MCQRYWLPVLEIAHCLWRYNCASVRVDGSERWCTYVSGLDSRLQIPVLQHWTRAPTAFKLMGPSVNDDPHE